MKVLPGGSAVIDKGEYTRGEGNCRFRVPISHRDIVQTVSLYSAGLAPARRNEISEEVLYVLRGEGACYIDGHRYVIATGTGVYIPPGSIYQIENLSDLSELQIVSVCCPEGEWTEGKTPPVIDESTDAAPFRTVHERDRKSIATGNRTFKLLVNQEMGCKRVTQFIGVIPPGRAPMHHHTYEEAIFIIEGQGRVWTEGGSAEFEAETSIYLPRGVSHSLENTGTTSVRLLGVFHPSGSPAARYDD